MTDYQSILIISLLRLLLACGILFTVMPALLFPPFPSKSIMERFFGMLLFMAGITMPMMHAYVFLKLNDNVAILIISIWIIAFKWWTIYRRRHVGFVLIKSVLLRWIEILARPSTARRLGISLGEYWRREVAVRLVYGAVFIAIATGAVMLRIGPIWDHPAPLSPEYYETLDLVKHLQINEMYTGVSRMPIGMPLLISALCTASQVNPTLAVHFFGLLSAILVCGSIFFSVVIATRSRIEGALASVVFAVAYGLFPGSVNHQIEADSLTLAVVFLLPSVAFFITYVTQGGRARLFASLSGLLAAGMIDLFIGTLGIAAFIAVMGSSFFILPSLPRLRGGLLVRHASATAASAAVAATLVAVAGRNERLSNVLGVVFYDQHFYRFASADAVRDSLFLLVCAVLFAGLIAASVFPAARKQWHLHLIGWGFIGTALLVLAGPSIVGLESMIPVSQVMFVLSVTASVAAGLCAGVVLDVLEFLLASAGTGRAAQRWIRAALGAASIASVSFLFIGTPASSAVTAEPDAFVKNLYRIERTFIPYQWTIVAHRGILLAGMNRGRFLDYDYFTAMYDPIAYRHGSPGAIPTALVFIFIEKNEQATEISSEILPLNRDAMRRTREWCETYRKTHSDMTVFYSDDKIIIYELRDPRVPSLRV